MAANIQSTFAPKCVPDVPRRYGAEYVTAHAADTSREVAQYINRSRTSHYTARKTRLHQNSMSEYTSQRTLTDIVYSYLPQELALVL